MTYIFGNIIHTENRNDFTQSLNNFGFNDNDKFVHLNKCISFQTGFEFFKGKQNYSMHNTDSNWNSPMGIFCMMNNWKLFKESMFNKYRLTICNDYMKVEEFNIGEVVNDLIRNETNPRYVYPELDNTRKPYTLGFYSYFFWRRYFRDDVILVNFYGISDPSYNAQQSNKWHDLSFEENYLNKIGAYKIFI